MRRTLVLLLAAGAAVALPATATADPVDPPCEFVVHAPDVHVDPDGPRYVTVTPRHPHYTC